MKTIARKVIGALALLASTAGLAATVEVRPVASATTTITSGCCAATVDTGSAFSLIVHGDGFPTTAGATLGMTWDANVVSVTGVVSAPGTPFTGGVVAAAPWSPISILGPLVGTLPSGSFDSFQINFQAVGTGAANIQLVDDQLDLCWSDAATFGCVIPTTYTQADITVGSAPPVPVPAAAWLIAPALLAAGRFSRRRKA